MSKLVDMIISVYSLGLIAYSLLSWLRNPQTDKARAWLGKFYEPLLAKLRASVKPVRAGASLVDLSPMILLFGLIVLKGLILNLLPRGW